MTNQTVILSLFNAMKQQNIICAYHGDFNYEVVNGLLKTAKRDLESIALERSAAKRTYNVLVECLENIHKHAKKFEEKEFDVSNEGIFILTSDEKGYSITVGNLIQEKEVDNLKTILDDVNEMDRAQLKSKYRDIITNGSISEKGGAGLGIIDISLKSRSHLNYQFHEYDEAQELKFFTLGVNIDFQIKK